MHSRLQYISQGENAKEQTENIQAALDAGCTWVQLRFKNSHYEQLVNLAEKVKDLCSSYNAVFIVNDNVAIAKSCNADGVHLGLQDMPVAQARTILGSTKIIGGTANTFADVRLRAAEKCNYIGLGPFRFTVTKEKLSPVLGSDGYALITAQALTNKIEIPIYAIGGITVDDVGQLMETGVYGVAVSSTLTKHVAKKELIQKFNSVLYEKINDC